MCLTKLGISHIKAFKSTLGSIWVTKKIVISPIKTIVSEQINKLNKVYMRVIRLDELKLSQDKVNTYQERLLETQTNRRDVSSQLTNIRHESIGLQTQINEAKRTENDDRYIELVRIERELKRKENTISDQLGHVDKLERDLFTALANAIRDSHVTQRVQAEYTKYFSIILSIFGSFASFLFFMVRKEEMKEFIENKIKAMDTNSKLRDKGINESIFQMTEIQRVVSREMLKQNEISKHVGISPHESIFVEPIKEFIKVTDDNSKIQKYSGIALPGDDNSKILSGIALPGDDNSKILKYFGIELPGDDNSKILSGIALPGDDNYKILKYSGIALCVLILFNILR